MNNKYNIGDLIRISFFRSTLGIVLSREENIYRDHSCVYRVYNFMNGRIETYIQEFLSEFPHEKK